MVEKEKKRARKGKRRDERKKAGERKYGFSYSVTNLSFIFLFPACVCSNNKNALFFYNQARHQVTYGRFGTLVQIDIFFLQPVVTSAGTGIVYNLTQMVSA